MRPSSVITIGALLMVSICSCEREQGNGAPIAVNLYEDGKIQYPYIATTARWQQIETGHERLRVGMSINEVVEIMGSPDEVKPLYEPQKKEGALIGTTYWYVLRRLEKRGSLYTKEAIVRVAFSKQNKLTRIDSWGLDQK